MKSKLADITQESVSTQSRSVFESLKTFSPYLNAERVSIFLSMPSGEVQTDAIRYWAKTALLRSGQPHAVQLYGLALSEQFVSPESGGPVPVGQYDKNLHGLVLGDGEIKTSSDSPDTSALHRR
ncbi:hypothetical protein VDGE_30501 [Verticillium dahliae]|uniref:Uncharacterized protein n=1 Tax=Verticillium dahliae TaxID=27337 RepID=A0A444S992_VERDA|nr:hypothetical protein VDGE_30501 [Verticillium dahliae]